MLGGAPGNLHGKRCHRLTIALPAWSLVHLAIRAAEDAGYSGERRLRVVDSGEHRHPAVQAADPQNLRDRRPWRDEAETAPCRVGLVGDLDKGAEPAGVAEGQAGQVEQQQAAGTMPISFCRASVCSRIAS
jgi:hypothetical protein